MSKMGEYAAIRDDMQVPGSITIGAIEPIAVGTMVNIPGIGQVKIKEALPHGNYRVHTTELDTSDYPMTCTICGHDPSVFVVKPVQAIKWCVVNEGPDEEEYHWPEPSETSTAAF